MIFYFLQMIFLLKDYTGNKFIDIKNDLVKYIKYHHFIMLFKQKC